jgi:hypothetical protein
MQGQKRLATSEAGLMRAQGLSGPHPHNHPQRNLTEELIEILPKSDSTAKRRNVLCKGGAGLRMAETCVVCAPVSEYEELKSSWTEVSDIKKLLWNWMLFSIYFCILFKAGMSCSVSGCIVPSRFDQFFLFGLHLKSCPKRYLNILLRVKWLQTGFDWQLRLLDHSVHFTIHYSALHCLPSVESLLGWAQDLLQIQLSTIN